MILTTTEMSTILPTMNTAIYTTLSNSVSNTSKTTQFQTITATTKYSSVIIENVDKNHFIFLYVFIPLSTIVILVILIFSVKLFLLRKQIRIRKINSSL